MGVVYKAVLFLVLVAVTFRATATATLFNDCGGQGFDLYFLVDVGGVFRDLPGVSTLIERTMSTFIVNSTNVQVGVWLYGEVVSRSIDMNETTSANLPSKLAGLPRLRTRSRNLQTALRQIGTRMFGEADGDRPDMPNVVVLLTDSVSRAPSLTPGLVDEIYTVHGKIVNFAVVSQGASYDMRELFPIACKPNHIFQTDLPLTELINNGNALFFVRYIMCKALTEPGCYPPPVVTILPVNPRCRATIAASQERGFQAVDIVCQTEENFPEAVCEFYRVTDVCLFQWTKRTCAAIMA